MCYDVGPATPTRVWWLRAEVPFPCPSSRAFAHSKCWQARRRTVSRWNFSYRIELSYTHNNSVMKWQQNIHTYRQAHYTIILGRVLFDGAQSGGSGWFVSKTINTLPRIAADILGEWRFKAIHGKYFYKFLSTCLYSVVGQGRLYYACAWYMPIYRWLKEPIMWIWKCQFFRSAVEPDFQVSIQIIVSHTYSTIKTLIGI